MLDRLAEYRYQQVQAVLLFDNADQAGRRVLQSTRTARTARSLARRAADARAGRPLRPHGPPGRPPARSGRTADRRGAWQANETADYLRRSLAEAGRQSPVFDEPAVAKLHELSHGIPRRVSQLADLALVAGAGRQLQQIDADVVESVYQELGVVEV